jgi:hypothetical protein
MRNVVKGFQFSQMAVPKVHENNINSAFSSFHGPKQPALPNMRGFRSAPKQPMVIAKRPGKNVGIKGGYKV